MGIDIQSLKNKEQNNINNINSIIAYFIETQEFEDKLSNYVENELDRGNNTFKLAIELQEKNHTTYYGNPIVTLKFNLQDSNTRSIAKKFTDEEEDKINSFLKFIELLAEKTCNKLEELGFFIVDGPRFIHYSTGCNWYSIDFKLR
jgi:RNA binding exosome subunit